MSGPESTTMAIRSKREGDGTGVVGGPCGPSMHSSDAAKLPHVRLDSLTQPYQRKWLPTTIRLQWGEMASITPDSQRRKVKKPKTGGQQCQQTTTE